MPSFIDQLFKIRCFVCLALLFASITSPATHREDDFAAESAIVANATTGAAPGRKVVTQDVPATTTAALQWGSFLIYPELTLSGFYDDNLFATQSARVEDFGLEISPALWLQSDWERHQINFQAGLALTRYADQTSENTQDYRASAEGRYDISDNSNVYGGLRFAREHEDRESPDDLNGIKPTRYNTHRGYAGVFHQVGRWSLRLAGTAQLFDFRDVPFITRTGATAIINNDDRDRHRYTGGLRISYELNTQMQPFIHFATDNRRYRQSTDDLGRDRDSNGTRWLVGLRGNIPDALKFEGFVGLMRQDYDDLQLSDVHRATIGMTAIWRISTDTVLNLYADRSIEETTVFAITPTGITSASSYVNSYIVAQIQHALSDHVSAHFNASYARSDYVGLHRRDHYYGAGAGVGYRANRHLHVSLSYVYRKLNSSLSGESFSQNQIWLRLAVSR